MARRSPKVQWFAECLGPASNEALIRALNDIGITDAEATCPDMPVSNGQRLDLIKIPGWYIRKLCEAMRGNPALFRFRFFKRNGARGSVSPAEFLVKRRRSRHYQRAAKRLKRIKSGRK